MSDDNAELVARLARRPPDEDDEYHAWQRANEAPTVYSEGDWNAPIDETQADSMTVTKIIQGEFADLREEAAKWEPRPCPPRGQDGMTPRRVVLPPTVLIAPPHHVEGDPLL